MIYKASSVLVNNRSKKPVHIFNLKKRHKRQREAEKQLYHASAPTTGHIRIDEVSRFVDILNSCKPLPLPSWLLLCFACHLVPIHLIWAAVAKSIQTFKYLNRVIKTLRIIENSEIAKNALMVNRNMKLFAKSGYFMPGYLLTTSFSLSSVLY